VRRARSEKGDEGELITNIDTEAKQKRKLYKTWDVTT
jgi:hypothetical protein